jgi:uncharacterized cupin superfamily protein
MGFSEDLNVMIDEAPINAAAVTSEQGSPYPEPFASRATASGFQRLADHFGLTQFGVNLVTLESGAQSGLRHWHNLEDEFLFVLEGEIVLRRNAREHLLGPGMCVGFRAGDTDAHLVANDGPRPARYPMIGGRVAGDVSFYPDDDLAWFETESGTIAVHKDGRPY